MLTSRYLGSTKNLPAIMQKIIEGGVPDKFNTEHLKAIGFASSGDRAVVPLLKELGFLQDDGTPTQRYREYRDSSRSRSVLGEALREVYGDLFLINDHLTERDRDAIEGRFKATHSTSDKVAQLQAMTFMALLRLADIDAEKTSPPKGRDADTSEPEPSPRATAPQMLASRSIDFRYNIEIHLPATKDPEVYGAIFRSLKEHILDG